MAVKSLECLEFLKNKTPIKILELVSMPAFQAADDEDHKLWFLKDSYS